MIRSIAQDNGDDDERLLDLIAACIDRDRWDEDSDPWLTGGLRPVATRTPFGAAFWHR